MSMYICRPMYTAVAVTYVEGPIIIVWDIDALCGMTFLSRAFETSHLYIEFYLSKIEFCKIINIQNANRPLHWDIVPKINKVNSTIYSGNCTGYCPIVLHNV